MMWFLSRPVNCWDIPCNSYSSYPVVMYNLLLYKLCNPLVWCCTLLFVCLVTVGLLEYN